MSKSRVDILKEIDRLRAEISEREEQLDQLLFPEKQVQKILPADFSIYDEILKFLQENKEGLSNATIKEKLKKAFPNYGIDTRKVNSAIVYLKKRNDVEPIGRAKYKIKIKTSNSQEQGAV